MAARYSIIILAMLLSACAPITESERQLMSEGDIERMESCRSTGGIPTMLPNSHPSMPPIYKGCAY